MTTGRKSCARVKEFASAFRSFVAQPGITDQSSRNFHRVVGPLQPLCNQTNTRTLSSSQEISAWMKESGLALRVT
jgi:hypothetical protein